MQDRRSFVIGGAAVGALVGFEATALAVAVARKAKPSPTGFLVMHERADGRVTVYEGVDEIGGPAGGPVFIDFANDRQRFVLPPGHYWVERGGYPLLPRRPY